MKDKIWILVVEKPFLKGYLKVFDVHKQFPIIKVTQIIFLPFKVMQEICIDEKLVRNQVKIIKLINPFLFSDYNLMNSKLFPHLMTTPY